jgi:hypothetical protein
VKTQKLAENWGNINMQNEERIVLFSRQFLLLVIFKLMLSGCVAGLSEPTGGLQKNTDVLDTFETATILPDYNYYIQGVESNPEAIIGVKNSFQLRSKLWTAIDWDKKKLEKAVFWIRSDEIGFCTAGAGYLLLPDGEQVGVWYSLRERVIIKHPEANIVEIYPFDYNSYSPCQRNQWADDR